MKTRIAIFAAVSTDQQAAPDKDSLPRQVRDGRAWAADMDAEVVAVYEVPGHSRKVIFYQDAERDMPAYRRLRRDAEASAFDVLWCRERSRLGRTDALIAQVEAIVQQGGAEVYSSLMPHAVGEGGEAGAIFTSAVERAMAQSESVQRVAWHAGGMRARVRQGWPATRWPYGYRPVRDGNGKVVGGEFTEEAEGVRMATRLFLDGQGYPSIAVALNESPWRPRQAERWSAQPARYLMLNDFYAGYPRYAEVQRAEPSDKYPALWDADIYRAVLRERQRRRRGGSPPGSPLTSCVFCARCGWRMTLARYRSTVYFRCSKHLRKTITGEPCHANSIRESKLIETVERWLEVLRTAPVDVAALAAADAAGRAELERRKAEVEAAIEAVEQRHTRLALRVADGTIAVQAAKRADGLLSAELAAQEAALRDVERRLAMLPDPEERRAAVEAALAQPARLTMARRPALVRAGLRVWVESGKVVGIEFGGEATRK